MGFRSNPLGVALLKSMKMLEPASVLTLEVSRRLPLHFQKGNVEQFHTTRDFLADQCITPHDRFAGRAAGLSRADRSHLQPLKDLLASLEGIAAGGNSGLVALHSGVRAGRGGVAVGRDVLGDVLINSVKLIFQGKDRQEAKDRLLGGIALQAAVCLWRRFRRSHSS